MSLQLWQMLPLVLEASVGSSRRRNARLEKDDYYLKKRMRKARTKESGINVADDITGLRRSQY